MESIIPLTEFITYVLFSFLTGHVALQFVPKSKKPVTKIPKPVLLLAALGIIVFSLPPALQVVFYFGDGFGVETLSLFTQFEVGISWIFIGFMATLLWMTIYVEGSKYIQAFLILLMILAVGYASHGASLAFWPGFISHSVHFFAVTLWTGILLHVGWIAKEVKVWGAFLKWFTPLAIGCLLLLTASGLTVMSLMVDFRDYANSWALTYGQMLLLKHISIIPILAFAIINGILAKKIKENEDFEPQQWIQAETIFLMFAFFFTGIMGTLQPPHQVNFTIQSDGAASWVVSLIGKEITAPFQIQFSPSLQGILVGIMAIFFFALLFVSFYKKTKASIALLFGICFMIAFYLGIMLNITV
ncbi:CopD family protein [Bacillus sp. IB182487]|uniref:CopD family protein n=1 Tax=Metabacillus arenae TaxID=2771434 RepID=A0A926RXT1_9BACI|nr:CopD family protein [Metabacillus arenae]